MSINEQEYSRQINNSIRRFKNTKPPVIYQPVNTEASSNGKNINKMENNINIKSFNNVEKSREEIDNEQSENEKNDALSGRGCNPGSSSVDDASDNNKYKDSNGKFDIFKIFQIVPIGINIIAKAPVLASGFVDLMVGMQKAIVNVSLTSFDLFISSFNFSYQGFQFMFVLMLCLFENITNLNICIIFYTIDLILLICYLALISLLSLVDAFFLKTIFGISSVELVMSIYDPIIQINDFIFDTTGIHLIHYPDYITKMCYTCSFKLNTKKTIDTGKTFLDVIINKIPPRLAEPIRKFTSAAKKISSVFII